MKILYFIVIKATRVYYECDLDFISLVPLHTTQAQTPDQVGRGLVTCLLCQIMKWEYLHVGTKMQLNIISRTTISVTIRLILMEPDFISTFIFKSAVFAYISYSRNIQT